MRNTRVQTLAEVALAIALAAVLNYVGLHLMPQGGSFSLVMLPLIVVALRRGLPAGLIAGALYGVLDYLMYPVVVHPVQPLLDYPVAFAAVGVAGVFSSAWMRAVADGHTARAAWTVVLPAALAGALARYAVHVVSGYIFFAEYAPEGQPVLLYSIVYNFTYMAPSALACAAGAMVLLPALRNVGTQAPLPATER
jgi:thiamine transporter